MHVGINIPPSAQSLHFYTTWNVVLLGNLLFIDIIEEKWRNLGRGDTEFSTGIPDLDQVLSSLPEAGLIFLASSPIMAGRITLKIKFIDKVVIRRRLGCLIFTRSQKHRFYTDLLLSINSGLNLVSIIKGRM